MKRHLFLPVVLLGSVGLLSATEIESFLAVKGQQYHQTNSAAPVSIPAEQPYRFFSALAASNSVSGVTLSLPRKPAHTLSEDDGLFELNQAFTTKAQLDAAFGSGTYTFNVVSPAGTNKPALKLLRDAYPPVPHVSNWQDLQEAEHEFPILISWEPFTNATTRDFVMVELSEASDDSPVYSSPAVPDPGALAATNRSFTIPADELDAGSNYVGRLIFVRGVDVNTNFAPAAPNLGGFYRETRFALQTLPDLGGSRLQFTSRNFSAAEDSGMALLTVTRAGGDSGVVSFNLATANGTALNGADYGAVSRTITLGDGVTTTNISVPITDDSLLEGNETVNVSLSQLTGNAIFGSRSNAVLTILDNEVRDAGTFQFSRANFTAIEKGKSVPITVRRLGGSKLPATVSFYTLNSSALGGSDFVHTNGTLTFGPKVVSKTFNVSILNDTLDEVDEAFSVVIDQPSGGASLGTNTLASITIKDDDSGGVIQLATASISARENTNALVVTVKRTGGTAGAVTVNYACASITATGGLDYTPNSGTITFGSNELTKTITIGLLNDTLAEANETFSFQLSNPTGGAQLGGITNATCTILDDENSVSFTNATYVVTEAGPAVSINVVRSGILDSAVSVGFESQNGSAINGSDYRSTNGVLTFPAKSALKTITIPILNDTHIENTETFSVRLLNPQGGVQIGTISNVVVSITDNDMAGTIRLSSATYSGSEGKTVNVTIQRVGGAASGVSVQFNLANGTAAENDYVNASQTVNFAGGETNKTIPVTLNSDATNEGAETVNLSLSNATGGATLGTPSTATLTINNVAPSSGGGGGGGSFTLTAPGMKANATMGGTFNAMMTSGGLVGSILTITGTEQSGLTTRTIQIVVSATPGTTGSIPMTADGRFFTFSHGATSTSTFCTTLKNFTSIGTTGSINIIEWDTANKRFKATFSFTSKGASAGKSCMGGSSTELPAPTEKPSITSGQVWVNYF